jgi:hypothetical protein
MVDYPNALDLETTETTAELVLRSLERRYFSEIESVSLIEIVDDPSTASCYIPATKSIRLYFGAARFPHLAQILILHELVHHKLCLLNSNYAHAPYGEAFQAQIKEFVRRGAYDRLL